MTVKRRVKRLELEQARQFEAALDGAIATLAPAEIDALTKALEADLAGESIDTSLEQAAGAAFSRLMAAMTE